MKRIDVIVATRHRLAKLEKMLASVPTAAASLPVFVNVIFDEDWNGFEKLKDRFEVKKVGTEKHLGSVKCRNLLSSQVPDALIYATDDMIFRPGSIDNAALAMVQHFPDDDGVVGFVQEGNSFHPTGVAMVGAKFLARYPGKQIFFPGYFHFACQEVYEAAMALGKFYQCQTARLYHFHPGFHPKQMDFTHKEARAFKGKDFMIRKERQQKGLIWGING